MMKLSSLLIVGLLAACAPVQWSATGYGNEPRGKALAQCKYEAQAATAATRGALAAGFKAGSLEVQCMKARGFTVQD